MTAARVEFIDSDGSIVELPPGTPTYEGMRLTAAIRTASRWNDAELVTEPPLRPERPTEQDLQREMAVMEILSHYQELQV